jgi:TonB family protein
MASRLHVLDRTYRRRMAWTLPAVAALLAAASLWLGPVERRFERIDEKFAALKGPLEILPQIDIAPDEIRPRRETAAPRLMVDSDFTSEEIRIVNREFRETPETAPEPLPALPDPAATWTEDDLQTEIRTTGLPVLARADFEVLYFERPVYPRKALLLGTEGVVEAMLLVGTGGRVLRTYILEPNRYPLLERATVDALSAMVFRPYAVDGRPTSFWVKVPVEFRLVN